MDVRYRCCEHCQDQRYACTGPSHAAPCPTPTCPGRMPIDPETEG